MISEPVGLEETILKQFLAAEALCIELQLNRKVFWNYILVWYSK